MDENGVHLQIDVPNTDLLTLKTDNDIIRIEKDKFERIEETDFLPFNNIGRLTFFHPGEFEADETPEPPIKHETEIKNHETDSTDILSASSVRKLSDMLIQAPLETTTAIPDLVPFHPENGHIVALNNTTAFHENVMNVSSNSSFSEWSSEEIGAVFLVCLMVPFIILSNLFVIVSVVRFRRLHTPTNYFITSLASVDIVVALATPLAIAVQLFQYGGGDAAHDTVLCLLPNRILMMACGVSLLTLATIAYDRHTALISPLEYVNIMTSRKVGILMTASWLYSSVVVWFPIAAGWYDVMSTSTRCSSDHLHPKVHILFFSAVFVPSCTVIMICYSRIFLVARHHAKAIAAVEFAVHRRLQVRFMIKDTKYAITLALVIGAFLLLWLPHLIYTFIKTFGEISISIWLETYLILMAVFNSGINPWIYAFKNNEFRAAFKRMAKEYCSERFCKLDDRRSSLVSGISITPRLSRTDSRMVSTILEPTVDCHGNEKLRRSLDSLDDYEIEVEQTKGELSEPEIKVSDNNENCEKLPKLHIVKEIAQTETLEGHVNWGVNEDDEEINSPENENNMKNNFFRKNSGSGVARNQSFTMGFNQVCCNRDLQKDSNDQLCLCKNSNSFTSQKLMRSSSSVTPSSTIPYSLFRRTEVPLLSSPLNLRISALTSPPSSSSTLSPSSESKFPFPSLTSSIPSPQTHRPNRTHGELLAHATRPRPSRGLCNQVQVGLRPNTAGMSAGNLLLNDSNATGNNNHSNKGLTGASKLPFLHHERHLTDINCICYPNANHSSSNSICPTSACITQAQSCPTFAQTMSATANFSQTTERPQDIACLPRGHTSALGMRHVPS